MRVGEGRDDEENEEEENSRRVRAEARSCFSCARPPPSRPPSQPRLNLSFPNDLNVLSGICSWRNGSRVPTTRLKKIQSGAEDEA